jgi:hypothetical protein
VRGWSGGVGAEAVAGVEGAGAPVSGRAGLRLGQRRGRWLWRGVRAERENRGVGEKFDRWLRLHFKGGRRGGGRGVGTAWRWSRREKGREGGLGVAGTAPRRAQEVGSGRRGMAWLTGGLGRDEGPVINGWVWREAVR